MTQSPFPTNNARSIMRHRAEDQATAAEQRDAEYSAQAARKEEARQAADRVRVSAQQAVYQKGVPRVQFRKDLGQFQAEAEAQLQSEVEALDMEAALRTATRLSALERIAAVRLRELQTPFANINIG